MWLMEQELDSLQPNKENSPRRKENLRDCLSSSYSEILMPSNSLAWIRLCPLLRGQLPSLGSEVMQASVHSRPAQPQTKSMQSKINSHKKQKFQFPPFTSHGFMFQSTEGLMLFCSFLNHQIMAKPALHLRTLY